MKKALYAMPLLLGALPPVAIARGVSPYLPLNLEPEIERQIERVLILADKPIMRRPIAAATVLDALPKACRIDQMLCDEVKKYIGRYTHTGDLVHSTLEGAVTSGPDDVVPNSYGLRSSSAWRASAQAYFQPSDYALVQLGGVAYDGDSVPAGSVVSLGFDWAQLDIGYRGHWLSPLTDSAMLLSTEAPTMPSVTLSNYRPLTRLGLQYEVFLARMSESRNIAFQNGLTAGNPRLAGTQLSIEPASGWSLSFNRIMQYGGGARGGSSFGDLLDAFFSPSRFDNAGADLTVDEQFGNQAASIGSRFLFPGRTPFAVYFEYGGEDTSRGRNYLLGNSALSAGIHFPRLWSRFDLTFEVSEWQNGWYVHHLYLDGLTNDGLVIGHWGADQRQFNDGVGANSQMVRLGWDPRWGGSFELRYRTLANESYSTVDYERAHDVTLRYSYPFRRFVFGGEVFAGRDVFGEDVSRVAAFVRYSPAPSGSLLALLDDYMPAGVEVEGAEIFVAAGVNANQVKIDLDDTLPRTKTDTTVASHFAIGARRAVSERSDLGVRLELDDIDGNLLVGARAVDYRFRIGRHFALTGFLGAARYDLATPAYGIYGGVGAQWRDVLPGWDISLDARYASKVARDDLLPTDVTGNRPDSFYDIQSATFYLTRRF